MSAPRPPRERRRLALNQLGGNIELTGDDPVERRVLSEAFSPQATETADLADVHGFHSYPARMHPETAERLIRGLTAPGARVLDPFCGSGTVLVEARRAGRSGLGYDVNPLSRELVWLKTMCATDEWLAELRAGAARVAEHADARRTAKAGASRRYPESDRAAFEPHVLLELDGLRHGIERIESPEVARALRLVLSSMLTKVSRKSGDTGAADRAKRVAAGFPSRFFLRRTEELTQRLAQYRITLPPHSPPAECRLGDARELPGLAPSSVDLVVTSPPYPGVYDYVEHHSDRLRWLGLPREDFDRGEIGSRRELASSSFGAALGRWEEDFGRVLGALARALRPEARIVLLIADSTLSGRALAADRLVSNVAKHARLSVSTVASQPRPHFHRESRDAFTRDKPRREHLVLLRRAPAERTPPKRGERRE